MNFYFLYPKSHLQAKIPCCGCPWLPAPQTLLLTTIGVNLGCKLWDTYFLRMIGRSPHPNATSKNHSRFLTSPLLLADTVKYPTTLDKIYDRFIKRPLQRRCDVGQVLPLAARNINNKSINQAIFRSHSFFEHKVGVSHIGRNIGPPACDKRGIQERTITQGPS